MIESVRRITNLNILKYLMCSIFTMLLETIIGLIIIIIVDLDVVFINSISIMLGATVHYLLISKKVFHNKIEIYTVIKYILSFIMGLFLQNLVLSVFYGHILVMYNDNIRFIVSKVMSVGISFVVTYFIRKNLFMNKKTD